MHEEILQAKVSPYYYVRESIRLRSNDEGTQVSSTAPWFIIAPHRPIFDFGMAKSLQQKLARRGKIRLQPPT
jgi:hypothetical protein